MGHDHPANGLLRPLGLDRSPYVEQLRRLVDELFNAGRPKERLHHYLTSNALMGFLKTQPCKLWASLATHLNDYDEIVEGQRAIREQLDELVKTNDLARAFLSRATTDWTEAFDPETPWTNIFVACFSEHEDALELWRGYGGAKRGYALTFEVTDWPRETMLVKVRYDDSADQIRGLFKALLEFYVTLPPERGNESAVFESLKRGLGLAAAAHKRKQWKGEGEWRLVQWCEEPAHHQFRERDGRIIPYHEVDLPDELVLQKITFGPGFHHATEKRALELLRDQHPRGRKIAIEPTKVRLRPD